MHKKTLGTIMMFTPIALLLVEFAILFLIYKLVGENPGGVWQWITAVVGLVGVIGVIGIFTVAPVGFYIWFKEAWKEWGNRRIK